MATMTNISYEEGMKFKIRVKPNADCTRFSINIGNGPDDVALHINPRFNYGSDVNTIVLNHCAGGSWGQEERVTNFPFVRGEECKLYIKFHKEKFTIKFVDGSTMTFPNRIGDVKYDRFFINDEATLVGMRFTPLD